MGRSRGEAGEPLVLSCGLLLPPTPPLFLLCFSPSLAFHLPSEEEGQVQRDGRVGTKSARNRPSLPRRVPASQPEEQPAKGAALERASERALSLPSFSKPASEVTDEKIKAPSFPAARTRLPASPCFSRTRPPLPAPGLALCRPLSRQSRPVSRQALYLQRRRTEAALLWWPAQQLRGPSVRAAPCPARPPSPPASNCSNKSNWSGLPSPAASPAVMSERPRSNRRTRRQQASRGLLHSKAELSLWPFPGVSEPKTAGGRQGGVRSATPLPAPSWVFSEKERGAWGSLLHLAPCSDAASVPS